jgi:hypothetical protein
MSRSDGREREAELRELRRILRKVIASERATLEGVAFLDRLKFLLLEEFRGAAVPAGQPAALQEARTLRRRGRWFMPFRLAQLARLGEGRSGSSLRDVRERSW